VTRPFHAELAPQVAAWAAAITQSQVQHGRKVAIVIAVSISRSMSALYRHHLPDHAHLAGIRIIGNAI